MYDRKCVVCSGETWLPAVEGFVRCDGCGTWVRLVRPSETVYSELHWTNARDPDGRLRNLTQERAFKIRNWYGDTIRYVNSLDPCTVIDVGCGLGFWLSAINEKHGRFGIEPSEFAGNFARETYGLDVFIGGLQDARLPDDYADTVFLYHVIEHLPDPQPLLHEVGRVLKPGGMLLVGTPNIRSIAALWFGRNFRLLNDPTHVVMYHPGSLRTLLEDMGGRIERIEYPYFRTEYLSLSNILRMLHRNRSSPPFWGSVFTMYARLGFTGLSEQNS